MVPRDLIRSTLVTRAILALFFFTIFYLKEKSLSNLFLKLLIVFCATISFCNPFHEFATRLEKKLNLCSQFLTSCFSMIKSWLLVLCCGDAVPFLICLFGKCQLILSKQLKCLNCWIRSPRLRLFSSERRLSFCSLVS